MADHFAPKDGVIEALSPSSLAATCGHIVWACFRTHEVMTSYVDHQFENHSAISTEYVKFLATNSGSEKAAKLSLIVDGIQAKVNSASTDASKTGSKADSCSAKASDLAKEVNLLTKGVKALEEKGGT